MGFIGWDALKKQRLVYA